MNDTRNIAMTSTALVSSLGTSPEALRQNLAAERRGLSYSHRYSDRIESPMGEIPWLELGIEPSQRDDSDGLMHEGCRHVLRDLGARSGVFERTHPGKRGLFVGTTTSGINSFFEAAKTVDARGIAFDRRLRTNLQQSSIGQKLAKEFNIRGPVYTFSSSCAASAQAFVMAHDAVRMGWVDSAVVLGVDILNLVTIYGFEALQLLDKNYCRPFAAERAGINLSEAIVAVVLERSESSEAHTRVRSFAALSEAHHMTQPAPGGEWMRICMERALSRANLVPQDITYINPHGTGTLANDQEEARAVEDAFGTTELIHPTKRFTGHTLGVSGLLELVITSLKLEEAASGAFHNCYGIKNSFGFGGANLSIVLERGGL